ncbi:hypothetical protein FACS189449_13180 [Alphaproteobacteria bacterium]|nr:hypothetical protein FACS189449_13180 [Alphaproteobacteria bacterium]
MAKNAKIAAIEAWQKLDGLRYKRVCLDESGKDNPFGDALNTDEVENDVQAQVEESMSLSGMSIAMSESIGVDEKSKERTKHKSQWNSSTIDDYYKE